MGMNKFIRWVHEGDGFQSYLQIGKLDIYFRQEWSQFFKKCNWYTFHFWQFEVERDDYASDYTVDFKLLGLGVWLQFPQRKLTKQAQELVAIADEAYETYSLEEARQKLELGLQEPEEKKEE